MKLQVLYGTIRFYNIYKHTIDAMDANFDNVKQKCLSYISTLLVTLNNIKKHKGVVIQENKRVEYNTKICRIMCVYIAIIAIFVGICIYIDVVFAILLLTLCVIYFLTNKSNRRNNTQKFCIDNLHYITCMIANVSEIYGIIDKENNIASCDKLSVILTKISEIKLPTSSYVLKEKSRIDIDFQLSEILKILKKQSPIQTTEQKPCFKSSLPCCICHQKFDQMVTLIPCCHTNICDNCSINPVFSHVEKYHEKESDGTFTYMEEMIHYNRCRFCATRVEKRVYITK